MGTPYLICHDNLYNDFHDYVKTFGFDFAEKEMERRLKTARLEVELRKLESS
ncbi:hypothetical protein N8920_05615 [Opitutales bacterium]|nr:hypothetical protein [Opitutales bacterium]